jgi:hypothetical protein
VPGKQNALQQQKQQQEGERRRCVVDLLANGFQEVQQLCNMQGCCHVHLLGIINTCSQTGIKIGLAACIDK